MLNLNLLRIYCVVLDYGSFTKASEALAITQSAVSRAVQELERQLGMTLLERRPRGVVPTEAGALLGEHARRIFAHEQMVLEALKELRDLQRGQLSIGASSTIGIYMLPSMIGEYHRLYPGIELFLDIGNTQQVMEHLRAYRLEIAYVEGPVESDEHVQIVPWRDDALVVIAAPDHPLAQRTVLVVADLADMPFVLREPGSGTREVMEQALAARGITIRPVMELGSTEAVKQAVSAGLGLSLVSWAAIQMELETARLVVLNVADLSIRRQLSRAHVRDRPQSRALREWLKLEGR